MMGAMLSKFSRMGQIRSFKGEVFKDNQYVEEFEDFSEESDTFYSEYYNYDSIITIENDSNWINFWLIVEFRFILWQNMDWIK